MPDDPHIATGGWKRLAAKDHPIWKIIQDLGGKALLIGGVFAVATWSNVQSFDFDWDGEAGTILRALLGLGALGGGKAAWDKFGSGGGS